MSHRAITYMLNSVRRLLKSGEILIHANGLILTAYFPSFIISSLLAFWAGRLVGISYILMIVSLNMTFEGS